MHHRRKLILALSIIVIVVGIALITIRTQQQQSVLIQQSTVTQSFHITSQTVRSGSNFSLGPFAATPNSTISFNVNSTKKIFFAIYYANSILLLNSTGWKFSGLVAVYGVGPYFVLFQDSRDVDAVLSGTIQILRPVSQSYVIQSSTNPRLRYGIGLFVAGLLAPSYLAYKRLPPRPPRDG